MSDEIAATNHAASIVSGWDRYVEALRLIPDQALALMPEDFKRDPHVQQETAALVLSLIARKNLELLARDPDAPMFVPTLNILMRTGQPNPDATYRTAMIGPGGTYRLTGRRGTLHRFLLTQQIPPADRTIEDATFGNVTSGAELDMSRVSVDAEGRYDLLISPTRPDGYAGDWWQLDPRCNCLLVRMIMADWGNEVDPTLSIERIDRPIRHRRPDPSLNERRLDDLAQILPSQATRYSGVFSKYRDQGLDNQIRATNLLVPRGEGNYYLEGSYSLAEDEALIYETEVPATCGYWVFWLINAVYESKEWLNHQSHINFVQAPLDADGKLRLVVSARDPGVPNWLDNAGYPVGMIQGRWFEADSCPVPTVTKCKAVDVRRHLPPETRVISSQERQDVLRRRRRALMERPIW